MNSVERLQCAITEAEKRGFQVRLEPLQGTSGGLCEFGSQRWIFVDLSAPVLDQVEQVLSALRESSRREIATAVKQHEAA